MSDPVDFLTGRALPFGYTADTAPAGMRWVYDALAPAPGTLYGDVLPVKREADGRIGFAMPNVMREGLLGLADLLSGTETGELTGRGTQSITMGGLGAGMTLAPRGALAAGGGRGRATPDLPMDRASQLSRARETGFQPDLKLYHWTDKPDFPAFAYGEPRAKSLGLSQPGFWAAEDPRYLDHMARLVGRENSQGGRVIPLFARFSKPAKIDDVASLTHQDVYFNIRNAWGTATTPSDSAIITHSPTACRLRPGCSATPTSCARPLPASIPPAATAPTCWRASRCRATPRPCWVSAAGPASTSRSSPTSYGRSTGGCIDDSLR